MSWCALSLLKICAINLKWTCICCMWIHNEENALFFRASYLEDNIPECPSRHNLKFHILTSNNTKEEKQGFRKKKICVLRIYISMKYTYDWISKLHAHIQLPMYVFKIYVRIRLLFLKSFPKKTNFFLYVIRFQTLWKKKKNN